ncbi:UNVERIFIED_CONTAM: hypothetical protein FKN15_049732 [Acipenser sinensis]
MVSPQCDKKRSADGTRFGEQCSSSSSRVSAGVVEISEKPSLTALIYSYNNMIDEAQRQTRNLALKLSQSPNT